MSTTRQMIKASRKQLLTLVGMISFLLFFANIIGILSYNTSWFNQEVREKLGVYLYLNDAEATADLVYSQAIEMKEKLEEREMEVTYYSKEDAFNVLEKRLPNVISNFEKYGIDNPLPPTMYVMFDTENEYRRLKDTVLEYEDIIMNLDDLDDEWFSFSDQDRRSAQAINFTNFLTSVSYFLIWIIAIIIFVFLLFGLRLTFFRFGKQIEVEKLLWSRFGRIKRPFLFITVLVLALAFGLMCLYFLWFFSLLEPYMISVFELSVADGLISPQVLRATLWKEFLVIIMLGLVFTSGYVGRLIRKV